MDGKSGRALKGEHVTAGKRALSYIEIIRPVNCLFGSLSVLIGFLNARGNVFSSFSSWKTLLLVTIGCIVYFLIAGAGNTINDYFDVEIDRINRPGRPIPRGDVSPKAALIYFLLLSVAGIILAMILGQYTPNPILIPVIAILFSIIGYVYAWKGKAAGFPGNLMVGISFSSGIPFGALILVDVSAIPVKIWFFFSTCTLLLISRELVKGIEDTEGDRKFGIKTIANTLGPNVAKNLSIIFSILALFSFTMPVFYLVRNLIFVILVILGDIPVVLSIALLVRDYSSKKSLKYSSLFLKGGAFIGLITFIFASL
ncbi:MAG: geranylgeranylglycerol-phosphate geranylgeranyltransferase [Promethearchaeota archaeon]